MADTDNKLFSKVSLARFLKFVGVFGFGFAYLLTGMAPLLLLSVLAFLFTTQTGDRPFYQDGSVHRLHLFLALLGVLNVFGAFILLRQFLLTQNFIFALACFALVAGATYAGVRLLQKSEETGEREGE